MTEKIFYSNPYDVKCTSTVLDIIEKGDKYIVVLDKTIFYPEGGGQPCDLGTIDGKSVTYVYEKDDTVFHELTEKPGSSVVECIIDFGRRFDHMQQHSGEHLIAAMFYNLFKIQSTGFHMGTEYVTLDLLSKDLSKEQILEAETLANEYIYKNIPIITYMADKNKADTLPLRKTPKVDEGIRIVEIDKVDYSPCCGTHITKTGEIGIIKINKTESYKGMTRIYFSSGKRALLELQQKTEALTEVCKLFSTSELDIVQKSKGVLEELALLHREIRKVNEDKALVEAEKLKEEKGAVIFKKYEDMTFEDIQIISKFLSENSEKAAVLYSIKDLRLIFSYNGVEALNCGKIFKENIGSFLGRGGGSNKQAQGSFPDADKLEGFAQLLLEISTDILK